MTDESKSAEEVLVRLVQTEEMLADHLGLEKGPGLRGTLVLLDKSDRLVEDSLVMDWHQELSCHVEWAKALTPSKNTVGSPGFPEEAGPSNTLVFIASAMEGAADQEKQALADLYDALKVEWGETVIRCEGVQRADPSSWPSPRDTFIEINDALHACDAFILYYTTRTSSGALVELGIAMALGKPCLILTPDLSTLSYILRDGAKTVEIKIIDETADLKSIVRDFYTRAVMEL